MQFTITVNQVKSLEWGLNAQQALLFAFVYECPSWAKLTRTADGDFYALSKAKVIEELPLLTDKPDTVYRLLKGLADAGVIELSSTNSITLVRLTKKGRQWNRKGDGSEIYPTQNGAQQVGKKSDQEPGGSENNPRLVGKKSGQGRKKIRDGSEKNPTNQDTSNQGTNQGTSQISAPEASPPAPLVLVGDAEQPRCEIPDDMPGPRDPKCTTYRTWANYAIAYHKAYGTWPVWNRTVAAQIAKLVERLGQQDAPKVAAFYVLRVKSVEANKKTHAVGLLLQNAESYHTQWKTLNPVTNIAARQAESTQQNLSEMELALEEQRMRRQANAQ